ncbi:MAG: DUF2177 family protein [Candidatus Sericytochromatia bacterium]|nr:DUF2177 family protein [Candidatus Sericytochromatia bacterium]
MGTPTTARRPPLLTALATGLAAALTMLVLDLTWLGVVAKPAYAWMGALLRPDPVLPAAALFYVCYVAAVVWFAVYGAANGRDALRRGAAMGAVAYGTYELTNWAVVQGWPAALVPIDWAWGIALTGIVAWVGKQVQTRLTGGTP